MNTQAIEMIEPEAAAGFAAEIVTPDTAAEASELLVGIARWLRGNGSRQWSGLLDGEDSHGLDEAVRRGEAILFRDGMDGPGREKGRPAGLVLLLRQPGAWDRELWGEQGHEPYVYLHRLAVARAYAGSGLGRAILRWAREQAVHPGKRRSASTASPAIRSWRRCTRPPATRGSGRARTASACSSRRCPRRRSGGRAGNPLRLKAIAASRSSMMKAQPLSAGSKKQKSLLFPLIKRKKKAGRVVSPAPEHAKRAASAPPRSRRREAPARAPRGDRARRTAPSTARRRRTACPARSTTRRT